MKATKNSKTRFSAVVEIDPGREFSREVNVTVEIDKPETEIMYDDVEDAIYDKIETTYESQYYDCDDSMGWSKIIEIVVWTDGGEPCPVVPDSLESKINEMYSDAQQVLVLPEIRYGLTPEARMYLELQHAGIISENAPFNYSNYHALVELQNKKTVVPEE